MRVPGSLPLARHVGRHTFSPLLAILLCLVAFVAAAWVSTVVFDRLPHVEDEVAFLFQAKVIASGRMVAKAPALPQFFDIPFVIVRDGDWFGKYPPGYPAVLALGALVNRPWLINPLMGAFSVGLIYLAGRRLYGAPTGLLAAALAVASPFFLLQAGSMMSHAAGLLWATSCLVLFQVARRRSSSVAALAAGAALGMLFLSRPLTAVGIGIPYAIWAVIEIGWLRRHGLEYLSMILGFLPFLLALLGYNRLTTGDPLLFGYELWWPYDKIGFGVGFGITGNHTLQLGLFDTGLNVDALADYLFGWPRHLSLLPAIIAGTYALLQVISMVLRKWVGAGNKGCSAGACPLLGWWRGRHMQWCNRLGPLPGSPGSRDSRHRYVTSDGSTANRVGGHNYPQRPLHLPPAGDKPLHYSLGSTDVGAEQIPTEHAQRFRETRANPPLASEVHSQPAPQPELWDLLQVAVVASLIVVHIAYWTPGEMYGPRYYFEALGALVLLSARGVLLVAGWVSTALSTAVPHVRRSRSWATAAALLVVAGLVGHAFSNFAPREFSSYSRWYNIDGTGVRFVQAADLSNAVVFVQESHWTDYAPFFVQNAPSLDSDVVYAIDLGPDRNRELMTLYSGRTFFRYATGQLAPLPP